MLLQDKSEMTPKRRIIALLTDFGLQDHFVAVMKAVILNITRAVEFVDISHQIIPQGVKEASLLLFSSFRYFPKGTIFLVVVDPGVGSRRKAIAVKTKNYYFVAPDNGVLSLALEKEQIERIVSLQNPTYFLKPVSFTFQGRDIFSPVAGHLAKGVNISLFGRSIEKIEKLDIASPVQKNNKLIGQIIYIDRFGNLVSNLKKEQFFNFLKGKNFLAFLNKKRIERFYPYYALAGEDEPFFIEGSLSFLEVSLREKSACRYFKAEPGEKITIYRR